MIEYGYHKYKETLPKFNKELQWTSTMYAYNNYTQTLPKFNTMNRYTLYTTITLEHSQNSIQWTNVCMYTTITDIPKNMHTEKEEQTIRLILLSFLKDEKEEEKGISNGGEFQTVRAWN